MQDTPKLSVLVAFRDREPIRVERFLAGLAQQTFRDFELIFVDYGSPLDLAAQAREIVSRHPFARYVYNDARGMLWNKAQALNSGAHLSRGEYLLCTDIDLIYSRTALGHLASAARTDTVTYGAFQRLPRRFQDWPRLADGEVRNLPPSHRNAVGAVQLVPREAFFRVRGLDEFFRIWGAEDYDFYARLERAGYSSHWLDLPPIYHQWHPSVAVSRMPAGWLEIMNFHCLTKGKESVRNGESWGQCLTAAQRPSLAIDGTAAGAERHALPAWERAFGWKSGPAVPQLNAWAKIVFLRKFVGRLSEIQSGAILICEITDSAKIRLWELLSRSVLRFRCRVLAGRRFFDYRREAKDILWYTIVFSGLVADYRIEEERGLTRYILVKR
jgi:glycosyltransferase involved in cell wall biosynthesis